MEKKLFIAILCFISPLSEIKLFDIKIVEFFLILSIFIIPFILIKNNSVARDKIRLVKLIQGYLWFIFFLSIFSFYALTFPSFSIPGTSILKTPLYLSFAKIAQLVLAITIFFIILRLLINSPRLINFFASSYIYAGLTNAAFGISSLITLFYGFDFGGAYDVSGPRAKGFFFEGGPFGVYLISVAVIVLINHFYLRRQSGILTIQYLTIIAIGLLASQSKAGIILGLILSTMYLYKSISISKATFFSVCILLTAFFSGYLDGIGGYIYDISNFSELVDSRQGDTAFMMGRVMALILIPRMIAEHPLTGIGIGNYSFQRNNPYFLQGLPQTDYWDLPGLGLLSDFAELGIPLTLFFILLITKPLRLIWHSNFPPLISLLASFQFFYYTVGGQTTFIYPWLISAFALALYINKNKEERGSI